MSGKKHDLYRLAAPLLKGFCFSVYYQKLLYYCKCKVFLVLYPICFYVCSCRNVSFSCDIVYRNYKTTPNAIREQKLLLEINFALESLKLWLESGTFFTNRLIPFLPLLRQWNILYSIMYILFQWYFLYLYLV